MHISVVYNLSGTAAQYFYSGSFLILITVTLSLLLTACEQTDRRKMKGNK